MKTLDKYIEQLQELSKQGYGNLPIVYSADDEGNSYHTVNEYEPSLFIVEDINEYYLESAIEYDEANMPLDFKPNCIIIN